MSFYHKYRPETLEALKGNLDLVDSLNNYLCEPEKMPHSYLLHGPTGCGKTTVGRIIKNFLNITDADFSEINTSEMRGIDTIRELIKNCQFKPLQSSHRIYLIDECHKLTNDAQNAFLKILEDTPSHVIFILCTTDPDKLIKAVRGRCMEYQLKLLLDNEMKRLLKNIIRKEKQELEDELLNKIVAVAEGHVRNGIQLLEKMLTIPADKRADAVIKVEEETVLSIELCRVLLSSNNWSKVKDILNGLKGQEPETIRRQVMGYCQAVLLKSDNPKAGLILEEFKEPFYNTGFPGLVYACYAVVKNS